jgi:hypothetical protein
MKFFQPKSVKSEKETDRERERGVRYGRSEDKTKGK